MMADYLDPSIVMTASIGTVAVFTCFALSALLAPRRSYMYLGGMLGSALTTMFWMSLANMFFHSPLIMDLQVYGGLLLFAGYVVFDTQMIVEKADQGDNDEVGHAMVLFVDAVAIFVRVVIILMKNEERKRRRKDDRRRR